MLEIEKNSSGIHWVKKSKIYGNRGGRDVLISTSKYNNKVCASITLRNSQYKKFPSGYVMFGIAGTRLYLAESDSISGYKLCDNASSYNKVVKSLDSTLIDWCKNHRGECILNYDDSNKAYYVETNKEA